MRRRLHSNSQDSLDLLLDTLCNVFGGIILIACLLAMLSRPKVADTRTVVETEADRESGILLDQRIEMAQAELDGLQKLRAALQSSHDPSLLPLIAERDSLKKTAEKLRQEKARQDEIASRENKEKVRDLGQDIARLREQEQEIERKLAIANKDLEAAQQMKQATAKRLADLQLELDDIEKRSIEKPRFPRERSVQKQAAPIIIRHGQVFPLYQANGQPSAMVRRVPAVDGSYTAFANPGQGLAPHDPTGTLRQILRRLGSGDSYLTLYVYPDSYATLRELKKLIHELGLDYGMVLCEEHRVLIFNSGGAKPARL